MGQHPNEFLRMAVERLKRR